MEEHRSRSKRSSKYVRSFPSFELVYKEEFLTRGEAMKREYEIKQWNKNKKEGLVSNVL